MTCPMRQSRLYAQILFVFFLAKYYIPTHYIFFPSLAYCFILYIKSSQNSVGLNFALYLHHLVNTFGE